MMFISRIPSGATPRTRSTDEMRSCRETGASSDISTQDITMWVAQKGPVIDCDFRQYMVSRRSVLKCAALSLGAPLVNRGLFSLFAHDDTEYSARTVDLVRGSTV